MSKMSELSQVLDDLISCGEKMIQTANAIKECFSEDSAPAAEPKKKPAKKEAKAPEPETPSYSKEDVRALLAAKANEASGQFKSQVKAMEINIVGENKYLLDIITRNLRILVLCIVTTYIDHMTAKPLTSKIHRSRQ